MSTTYTYANLVVSARTYAEIMRLLKAAGYYHAFMAGTVKARHDANIINMNGLALIRKSTKKTRKPKR